MQTSIFLAKLIGPWMTILGVAALINLRRFRYLTGEFVEHPALLYLSSLVLLPAGLAIVLVHNIWTADWRVLVTVFGWLVLLSSAIRILAVEGVISNARTILNKSAMPLIVGSIWTLIGLTFCFFGYR
jgi:hypothetical protein